jgi:hypothetical protein
MVGTQASHRVSIEQVFGKKRRYTTPLVAYGFAMSG